MRAVVAGADEQHALLQGDDLCGGGVTGLQQAD
jgi:hypothetical protein